jgi:predicted membrane channel-forming protein YqfA (hemolysin III family)
VTLGRRVLVSLVASFVFGVVDFFVGLGFDQVFREEEGDWLPFASVTITVWGVAVAAYVYPALRLGRPRWLAVVASAVMGVVATSVASVGLSVALLALIASSGYD